MPNSNPGFASPSNAVPKLIVGTLSVPTFEVTGSVFRRSGQSYFSRFDNESEIDNTYTPIDGGLDLIFGGTGFQITSGQDLWVGTLVDSSRESIWIPLPACNITNFYVASSVAPGSGQTFIFTVYKDTVATDMTATISGSGISASYGLSTITYSAGEKFSVRIQTSGSATTAFLTYSARIE